MSVHKPAHTKCRSENPHRFAWEHKDWLPVFAAGNYGEKGSFTISAPGVAKNCLTVGASKSSALSFYDLGQEAGLRLLRPPELQGLYPVIPAAFGLPFHHAKLPADLTVAVADPPDACGELRNSEQLAGRAVLVRRGTCYFADKAKRLGRAGASLMVVVQNIEGPAIPMGGDTDPAMGDMPSVMVTRQLGEEMWTRVAGVGGEKGAVAIKVPEEFESADLTENNMAAFSSRGPTKDSRTKPDIVAPGMYIVSVHSDGDPNSFTCDKKSSLISMAGTSMATPIAAGGVLLVRQYFRLGFYPSGVPNADDSLLPSGALLKAMMVASGVPVGGTMKAGVPGIPEVNVSAPPSNEQGYGRTQLNTVLFFNDSSSSSSAPAFNLWVKDDGQLKGDGDRTSFCFAVGSPSSAPTPNASPALKATLVWADPPGAPSANVQMVNDLDLMVVGVESQRVWMGNGRHFRDRDGRLHQQWERNSNVEQIVLDQRQLSSSSSSPVLVSLHVRATHVPVGPQPYALVVTGLMDERPLSECQGPAVCPNGCGHSQGWGVCMEEGVCECVPDRFGSDCALQSAPFRSPSDPNAFEWEVEGAAPVGSWQMFHLDLTEEQVQQLQQEAASEGQAKGGGLTISLERTQAKGDPDVYVSEPGNGFPSLSSFAYVGTQCEPCGQHTRVRLPANKVVPGRYRVGVFGYCCDDTAFRLRVRVADAESKLSFERVMLFSALAVFLLCFALFAYCCVKRAKGIVGMRWLILFFFYGLCSFYCCLGWLRCPFWLPARLYAIHIHVLSVDTRETYYPLSLENRASAVRAF